MKVLHVISDLDCHAAAKQLTLLHTGLSESATQSEVCVLEAPGVFSEALEKTGVALRYLNWRRTFDLRAVWQLKKRLQQLQPNVIHVWGSAYRAIPFFGKKYAQRSVLAPFQFPRTKQTFGRWIDRKCLRNVGGLLVRDQREEAAWRQTYATNLSTHRYTPAVESDASSGDSRHPWRAEGDTEPWVIAFAGRLLPTKGLKATLLAFDMIRHVWPESHLLIMGNGSERERIGRHARGLFDGPNVHFLNTINKVDRYFRIADVVWAPDERDGGQNAVLEAMSVGRPVVASNWPLLHNIVVDGETGFLIPPGNAPELGRKTYTVFQMEEEQRRQMGRKSRQHVEKHFSVRQLVERVIPIYEQIAA